jgi:hypothetical protein
MMNGKRLHIMVYICSTAINIRPAQSVSVSLGSIAALLSQIINRLHILFKVNVINFPDIHELLSYNKNENIYTKNHGK